MRPERGKKSCDGCGQNPDDGKSDERKTHAPIVRGHPHFTDSAQIHRGLLPERGNSAANYDAKSANPPNPLRCQFGSFYDINSVGNSSDLPNGWLAERLGMGSPTYLSKHVWLLRRSPGAEARPLLAKLRKVKLCTLQSGRHTVRSELVFVGIRKPIG